MIIHRIDTGIYEIVTIDNRTFEVQKSVAENYWNLYELRIDPDDGEEISREWWETFSTLKEAKNAVGRI